jgi:hypothetical protein
VCSKKGGTSVSPFLFPRISAADRCAHSDCATMRSGAPPVGVTHTIGADDVASP